MYNDENREFDPVGGDLPPQPQQDRTDLPEEEPDEIVTIAPADGAGVTIDVIKVPESKTIKNRLHLDIRADGSTQAQEVERIIALGARPADVGQGPDVSWVTLADPEGNEFCVFAPED